jgi:hypothetical protein
MQSPNPNSEQPPVIPPSPAPDRRRELAIEILKFVTPALALVVFLLGLTAKYSLLSKPWALDILVVLGIFVLLWFAKPRLVVWLRRVQDARRDQRFVRSNNVRRREFVRQFTPLVNGFCPFITKGIGQIIC